MTPPRPRALAALCGLFTLTSVLFAAHGDALKRMKPVAADEPVPLTDFLRPALFIRPTMNEAGTQVAALAPIDAERMSAVVAELDGGETSGYGIRDLYDIRSIQWLDDKWVLLSLAFNHNFEGWYTGDMSGRFYPVEKGGACLVIGSPVADRLHPLFWVASNPGYQGRDTGVVKIDTTRRVLGSTNATGNNTQTTYGIEAKVDGALPELKSPAIVRYMTDRFGALRFAVGSEAGIESLFYLKDDEWKKCPLDLDQVRLIGPGESEGQVIVLGPRQDGQPRALQYMDAPSGALGKVLVQDKEYDCEPATILRKRDTRELLGVRFDREGETTVWMDPVMQGAQALVQRNFPGQLVSILDVDDKQNRFLVAAWSDRQPPQYYLVDLAKKSLGMVKNASPWIDPKRMLSTRTMKFPTKDGGKLDAFVTLPAGTSKEKPAPLVVYPHGGPYERTTWGWDPIVQFLASRGYAVLQPNYRGSPGYGWMFPEDDRYEYRKMHDDVTASVDALLTTGLIDSGHIGILGEGFGGYLALCGAAFESGKYRCAISMGGVVDWAISMDHALTYDANTARYQFWHRRLGDPKEQAERFKSISPLRHAAEIRCPVLLAYGQKGGPVPFEEAKRMDGALKDAGVPHETIFERDEGTIFEDFAHRVDLYTKIARFLHANLGGAE